MEKLDYMIGYQEHDLDELRLTAYHKATPVFGNRLLCRSYDQDGNYEGYQYGMYSNINKKNNPYAGWEPPLIQYLLKKSNKLKLLHVAYNVNHELVKKDSLIPFFEIPNLVKYYPDFDFIQEIDLILKMGFSNALNFQFYVDGGLSIEMLGLDTPTNQNSFIESCIDHQLITREQIKYVKSAAKSHRFSIKFKWKKNKLNLKAYVRDVMNWQRALTGVAVRATVAEH